MTNYKKEEEFSQLKQVPSVSEWLNEFVREGTKRKYLSRMIKFLQATNTSISELERLDYKALKRLVVEYQKTAKAAKVPNNTILSNMCAVRSYAASIGKPLKFKRGQVVSVECDNHSHIFTTGDLTAMFNVADSTEKAILATACSLGWEISAFLEELPRQKITDLIAHAKANGESYIYFDVTRTKTGAPRLGVLNPLSIEWLSKYLAISPNTEKLFDYQPDGIEKMLKRLAKDAQIAKTGSIRFHNIRKWLMSQLSRCRFNEFQIKYVLGKSIGVSDRTYLTTLKAEIEELYPQYFDSHLNISPQPKANNGTLASEVLQLRAANTALIDRLARLEEEVQRWQAFTGELAKKLAIEESKP